MRYYWEKEFPLLSRNAIAPVLTRLTSFLRRRRIRNVLCHHESRLDFRHIMDTGKVLLVKCAVGALGEENAYLLGALLVAKLQQTVMTRQELEAERRRPFFLYLDEFQSFITPSMEVILSGARKYGLGLTLAHQELGQLFNRSREVASSVLSNPYTRICFGVGDRDARMLSEGFAHFDAADLQRLSRGEAIARVERADFDFNLATPAPPAELPRDEHQHRVAHLLALSRTTYGKPVAPEESPPSEHENVQPSAAPIKAEQKSTALNKTPVAASHQRPSEELHAAQPEGNDLSPDEAAFVQFVGTMEELLPVREVYKRLQVSADKGTRLKAGLITKELVTEAEVPLQARGRASKLVMLTPRGRELVGLPPHSGKGGVLHQHLQQFIAAYAEQHGFTTAIEGQGSNGKAVDVALEKDSTRIAVEISVTTRAADEMENITKDLAGGFTCIVSLFVSPTTRDAVKRLLDEQGEGLQSDAVYCGLVKEYAGLIRQVSRTLG